MAIVPFRRLDQLADQRTQSHNLKEPETSGSSRTAPSGLPVEGPGDSPPYESASLANVGRVVWQSGYLLAEYLVRQPPFGEWADVRVVDLGAGTGMIGIALALAGAQVILTDLPHITALAAKNVEQNRLSSQQCQVVEHEWGAPLPLSVQPDVITGGDLVYAPESHGILLQTLQDLCAAHTIIFLSFRVRGAADLEVRGKLEGGGFVVDEVPEEHLQSDFRGQQLLRGEGQAASIGSYHILAARKLPP